MCCVWSVACVMQLGQKSQRDKLLLLQYVGCEGKQLNQQRINLHLLVINCFCEGKVKQHAEPLALGNAVSEYRRHSSRFSDQ